MNRKRLLLTTLLVAVLGLGVAAFAPRVDDDLFALRKNFEIYGAVYEALATEYVDPLDPEQLMQTGVEAMLSDTDPYTTFMDEGDYSDARLRQGQYGSVGLNLDRRGGKITVTAPEEGTSSYKQGVRAGDVIRKVAGQQAAELTLQDVARLLRGEPGTTVPISVRREGVPEPLEFVLTRKKTKRRSLSYSGFVNDDTSAGLGYVKLDQFGRKAGQETRQAVKNLQAAGALSGLVLDLRDNPGGLLQEAVTIAGLFVPQDAEIVSMRGRTPESQRVYRSSKPPLAPDVPVVVLVNELSASASEIVAGAIQDLDRGIIAGTTTYGKGLVQTIKELPYNTSLKLTLANYYTPSGRSIQSKDYSQHNGTAATIPDSLRQTFQTAGGRSVRGGGGIEPDVTVSPKDAGALEQALKRRAAFFFFANTYAARHDQLPSDFEVTDETLDRFADWLDEQNFSYRTDAQRSLEQMTGELQEAGYADDLKDQVAALRAAMQREKQDDFERHAERLKAQLREEILARYLSETEQVKAAMAHDPSMQQALRLLNDDSTYRETLN